MAVFLGVGTRAVAVFEIEPQILHGLALQFREHARVDGLGQRRAIGRHADRFRERRGRGAEFVERGERCRAIGAHRITPERVAGADQRVHRLPAGGVAREQARQLLIRRFQHLTSLDTY